MFSDEHIHLRFEGGGGELGREWFIGNWSSICRVELNICFNFKPLSFLRLLCHLSHQRKWISRSFKRLAYSWKKTRKSLKRVLILQFCSSGELCNYEAYHKLIELPAPPPPPSLKERKNINNLSFEISLIQVSTNSEFTSQAKWDKRRSCCSNFQVHILAYQRIAFIEPHEGAFSYSFNCKVFALLEVPLSIG